MRNCTLCYLENDRDQYLMLHRVKKKNDVNHDKWIGVGGKFEDKESPEECVLRETREETGFTLTDYRYRGLVTFVNTCAETEYMHLFTATGWTGEPIVCDEGNLEWVDKSRITDLPIWEGDKVFLRLIRNNDTPFFSLKLEYDGDTLERVVLNGKEWQHWDREPLLVSACLLGCNCKYSGGHNKIPEAEALAERYDLIPVCPESQGGLPIPRIPAERQGSRVVNREGVDVTAEYERGAEIALRSAWEKGCSLGLLKERSPSCGLGRIYDGTFTHTLVEGDGAAAELLRKKGFTLLGESRVRELL